MVRVQMLSELEEIIQYKRYADQFEQQNAMKRMLAKRWEPMYAYIIQYHLSVRFSPQGCQPVV